MSRRGLPRWRQRLLDAGVRLGLVAVVPFKAAAPGEARRGELLWRQNPDGSYVTWGERAPGSGCVARRGLPR